MAGYAVSILKINAIEVYCKRLLNNVVPIYLAVPTDFNVQVKLFNFSNGNEIQREMLQPSKA